MRTVAVEELLPGLFRFADTCNVYVCCGTEGAIAVDFGSGAWLAAYERLDRPPLRHVFLTHHHPNECAGLATRAQWPFTVHAPAGDAAFLDPRAARQFWKLRGQGGVPASYAVLPRGLPNVRCDMNGFSDLWWGRERVRFLATPGHGPHALSVIVDHGGKQVVFCGDAAHAGATVCQPYHLEWDHWTGTGVLAAWEGIERLNNVGMDLLCPAHGPPLAGAAAHRELKVLAAKLLRLYRAKGSICPREKDRYCPPRDFTASGAREVLPGLYQCGTNGYLLLSARGEALVVDPTEGDLPALRALLKDLGQPALTAATASHYHLDHTDGLPLLKREFGTRSWLHPWVAQPLSDFDPLTIPWLPRQAIRPDHLWPEDGRWTWHEYEFRVAPFPGQTWWHCGFMTTVAGQKVFFGGDNFQPNSRWNGTGGFCAFNGSRFQEGFVASAQRLIEWAPDLLCNGHGCYFRYRRQHFEKIIAWAHEAEAAVRALCPSGDLEQDYFLHRLPDARR